MFELYNGHGGEQGRYHYQVPLGDELKACTMFISRHDCHCRLDDEGQGNCAAKDSQEFSGDAWGRLQMINLQKLILVAPNEAIYPVHHSCATILILFIISVLVHTPLYVLRSQNFCTIV